MEFYSPGFGRLVQPKLYVQVRAPDAPSWSMRFSALVDTGASITLINEDLAESIPGLDAAMLGDEVAWTGATGVRESCRPVDLDIVLGAPTDEAPLLRRRRFYFAKISRTVRAEILLGQRGILDELRLIHSNCGPRPSFRFAAPR